MNPASTLSRTNAWVFTCESWAADNTYIVLPVNPSDFTVQMPIRKTVEDYRAAKIAYSWREPGMKSMFGPMTMQFQVSSGNALPVFRDEFVDGCFLASQMLMASDDTMISQGREYLDNTYGGFFPGAANHANTATGIYADIGSATDSEGAHYPRNRPALYYQDIPIGIQNAYALHALVDERRIRSRYKVNGVPSGHTDNRVVVTVNTLAFPRLTIYGWFGQDGIQVSESVDAFGEVTCSFSLHVTDTFPRLSFNHWERLMQAYRDNIATEESTLQWTRTVLGLHEQRRAQAEKPATRDSRLWMPSSTGVA